MTAHTAWASICGGMGMENKQLFMAVAQLPQWLTPEMAAAIPAQRAEVAQLMQAGTLRGYSLAADRRSLWMTFNVSDEAEAWAVIKAMPLYPWMEVALQPLLFSMMPTQVVLPTLSMN